MEERGRGGGGAASWGLRCLVRRKRVDSPESAGGRLQLARRLSVFDLVAIGVLISQFYGSKVQNTVFVQAVLACFIGNIVIGLLTI